MEGKKAATAASREVKGDSEGEGEEEDDVWKRMKIVHEKPLKSERSVTLCQRTAIMCAMELVHR